MNIKTDPCLHHDREIVVVVYQVEYLVLDVAILCSYNARDLFNIYPAASVVGHDTRSVRWECWTA